ncbi:pathogenesis-related protein 1A [Momordica charantia]|uniref:Pathogenesis-related protein 1A n=1 Tax=Momordica charantia TaxID=3673 RepID=A0A6J1CQN1_MOMCH|nr:pathogenesis-related protein 1A [Momordica charantia]
MSPPPLSILPSLLLCISLLLPIASHQQQSQPSNGDAGANATASGNQNHTAPRRGVYAREFLVAHNKVRTKVTHPPFGWDKKLARYARRWGMKRCGDCKMIHSYGPYGENLFWGALDHWTPTEVVESWASEVQFYDAQNNACSEGQMCGHYTQIIWKDSAKIGCARVQCQSGGLLIICEYDPPGNYVNESPFDTFAGGASARASAPTSASAPASAPASPTNPGNTVPPPVPAATTARKLTGTFP